MCTITDQPIKSYPKLYTNYTLQATRPKQHNTVQGWQDIYRRYISDIFSRNYQISFFYFQHCSIYVKIQ